MSSQRNRGYHQGNKIYKSLPSVDFKIKNKINKPKQNKNSTMIGLRTKQSQQKNSQWIKDFNNRNHPILTTDRKCVGIKMHTASGICGTIKQWYVNWLIMWS